MATYATGHVRAPDKDHQIELSHRRHGKRLQALLSAPLPASFDCRQFGWVGPVKNQGQCGSCWDFSGTGVVEGAYNKAGVGGGAKTFVLSEEYTLSCGRNGGCGGDDNVTVLQWAKQTGLPMTADYGPYQGSAGRCNFKQSMNLFKIDDWGFCDANGGQGVCPPEDIKATMMAHGPIGSGIAADNAFMNATAGQVFNRTTSTGIDHDIILVGWEDSSTRVTAALGVGSVSITASDGWWWLRNSWGASWCEQGYIRIGWGVNRVGTEAVFAVVNQSAPPIDWGSL